MLVGDLQRISETCIFVMCAGWASFTSYSHTVEQEVCETH